MGGEKVNTADTEFVLKFADGALVAALLAAMHGARRDGVPVK